MHDRSNERAATEQPVSAAYEFSFGPFRLLGTERVLQEGERPVRLGSRALDILLVLVTRAGELVSKRELVALVWPDTVVVEANLTVHVAALRRALGDGQGGNRYIVNVPGRGYRFVAPVTIMSRTEPIEPPPASPAALHNLPAQLTRLIGREAAVCSLSRKTSSSRLVTIVGPGGVGKTAVALEVAERTIGGDEDGVWLVDLAPVTNPQFVMTALASALKLEIRSDHPLPSLVGALLDKRMLLVLDNCEHVIEDAASLARAITRGARGVRLLATSREPLHVEGEQIYRLKPLETPPDTTISADQALDFPAVQLFVERAAAASNEFVLTDADAPGVTDICRKLDGLPLAIEFAAARVDAFGVRGLASRLDDRLSLLGEGPRGQQRHHTIGATLDWSYHLLSPPEQATFRRLAIFVGGFTIESARAVIGGVDPDSADITDHIASLVAKSLIVAGISEGDARFRFLVTTRAYALDALSAEGEADLLARQHAAYFVTVLEVAVSDHDSRRAPIAPTVKCEIDNIRAALGWAFGTQGDKGIAVALAAASAPIWLELSLPMEGHRWAGQAISMLADGDRGTAQEMMLQTEFGLALMYTLGASEPTRAALARGYEIAEQLGDADCQLRTIAGLTNLCLRLEDFRGALAWAKRAESIAARSTDPIILSTVDFLFSGPLVYLAEYAQSMAYAHRAFSRMRAIPQRAPAVRSGLDRGIPALCVVASIYWVQGAVDQASRMTRQIIADAEARGHALPLCFALAWCGCAISLRLGDLREAERSIKLLSDWSERHDLPSYRACALGYEGSLLAKRGDLVEAESKLRAGLSGLRDAQFEVHYTPFLGSLAEVLARNGRLDEGLILADESLARTERNDAQWWRPEALRIRGELCLLAESPDIALAENYIRQALDLSARQGALFWELRAAMSLGEIQHQQGRTSPAYDLLESVYAKFTEGQTTADVKRARSLLDQWTS